MSMGVVVGHPRGEDEEEEEAVHGFRMFRV